MWFIENLAANIIGVPLYLLKHGKDEEKPQVWAAKVWDGVRWTDVEPDLPKIKREVEELHDRSCPAMVAP